jgi:hypothetical protein
LLWELKRKVSHPSNEIARFSRFYLPREICFTYMSRTVRIEEKKWAVQLQSKQRRRPYGLHLVPHALFGQLHSKRLYLPSQALADRFHGDMVVAISRTKELLLAEVREQSRSFGATKVKKVIALLAGVWCQNGPYVRAIGSRF